MYQQWSNILLYDVYEEAFFGKAIEEGFAKPYQFQDDELDIARIADWNYEHIYKYNHFKSAVLQMFLLYDKAILLASDPSYEVDKLTSTGLVDVIPYDPFTFTVADWNSAEREYAMYLKPYLIDSLLKEQLSTKERKKLKKYGFTPREFVHTLYDVSFLPDRALLKDKAYKQAAAFIKDDTHLTYERQKDRWTEVGVDKEFATHLIEGWWRSNIIHPVEMLMALLERSILNNAVLMQSEFKLDNANLSKMIESITTTKSIGDSYQILRISFEKTIGQLPKLNSLTEVLRLKEKRHRDITRLRSVLNEIEQSLREGRTAAINKAENELSKAAKDLSWGNTVDKVSRWTTYLSLPVSIIELYLAMPPVAGISFALLGTASTLTSNVVKAKNQWIQVLR